MTGDMLSWLSSRGEKISSHAHKTGSWFLLGVVFNIFGGHPCHFDMEVPPLPLGTSPATINRNRFQGYSGRFQFTTHYKTTEGHFQMT